MINIKKNYREIYNNKDISQNEKDAEIDFTIEIITGYKPKDLFLGKEISKEQNEKIIQVLKEHVKTNKPLQYILGQAFFASKKFFVNESTLIPRPETEFVLQECLHQNTIPNPKILDIGTGSGCIAIELSLQIPNAKITACDICQETLDVAIKNAELHKVSDKITFVQSDIFSNIDGIFDIIISNPPYISFSETEETDENVRLYEPHRALFAKDDGLYFYKKISEESKNFLKENGLLIFETGWKQSDKIKAIMQSNNFVNINLTKDLDNNNRGIYGYKTN